MLLPFTKAHGTANHFIIIYLPECQNFDLNEDLIQKLCNPNIGIGADGLLIVYNHNIYDYKIDYYNNDGTWETMCANGARCVGLLMYEKKLIPNEAEFLAGDGIHKIKILDETNVELTISSPKYISDKITIDNLSGFSIDSGAKHFVVEVKNNIELEWDVIGKKIRNSKYFQPNGTNVNFVKKINENTLEVITYEKGVEQIMQSCGSGSVAAAYHMQRKYNLNNKLNIQTLGGDLFITSDPNWQNVWLKGEAKLLFNAKVNIKNI